MASSYFSLISRELDTLRSNAEKHDEYQLYESDINTEEHDEDQVYESDISTEEHDEDQVYESDISTEEHDEDEANDDEDQLSDDFESEFNAKILQQYEFDIEMLLYEFDVEILKMFCSCLEAWESCTTSDEQIKESLSCMITHLKVIWVEEKEETWPQHIQHFDPQTFGLEPKIQLSKQSIEQWCKNSISSFSMQCKSSTNRNFNDFAECVLDNVHRAAEIVPFKKQFDILIQMLEFLSDSFYRVRECTNSKELLEYKRFVHAFFNNAACLICLYWAKEAIEEEIATKTNIAPFDMLHNIKPYAADVMASYFAVIKSNNVMKEEDEIQIPATFVDFFFKHTILKDGFLILRERLIVLFTYLNDTPHENAQKEEELVRNQVYALFREDAYLLLPISEMKQDFSNEKKLLSDFMNKIDILTDKIILLCCRPSDSWYRLEVEKMNNIYFPPLQRELSHFQLQDQVQLYLREIRFLRSFFQCFETWDDSNKETNIQLRSMVTSLQMIWGQEYDMRLLPGRLYAIHEENNIEDWTHLSLELIEKFRMSKQEINAWLVSLSHCSFHCRLSTSNKILKFMDSILYNMHDLITSGACKDAAFEKQIEIIEEKLLLLKNFLTLATNSTDSENLEEFNMLVQVLANNAACLIYTYWTVGKHSEVPAETNLMLSNMLQNIKPDTPAVARMYIGTLKAISLQPYDSLLFEQTAMSFVDYFFEDLVTTWKNDYQIIRDEIIFYLTFVHHHHPTGNAGGIVCSQLDVLFSDGMYDLLPFDDKKKVGLNDSMMNIGIEIAKIRQLYCKLPDSLLYNFPRIIGQGFLDCLVQKLRNLTERLISDQKYTPFAEYKIKTIEEELLSLTPVLNQIMELKDLNDAL